jgi:hypothetical protein
MSTGNANRTIGLWVSLNTYPPDGNESFFAGYGNFTQYQAYVIYCSYLGNKFYFSSWATSVNGTTVPNLGQWYYVAVTNEGNSVTIYVNGIQENKRSLDAGKINTPSGTTFYMGKIAGAAGNIRKLKGYLDDVRIYNRALSPGEIQYLYTKTQARYK